MMEWISVKDRLPDNPEKDIVLCYIDNTLEWMTGSSRMYVGVLGASEIMNTTHWMPLPEPPKTN